MRPKSLRIFDMLFLGGIILGFATMALGNSVLAGESVAAGGTGGPSILGAIVLSALMTVTLWYLISRVGIQWLKWLLAALVLYGLFAMAQSFSGAFTALDALRLVASLMQAAALVFLFRADAKAWFAAENG